MPGGPRRGRFLLSDYNNVLRDVIHCCKKAFFRIAKVEAKREARLHTLPSLFGSDPRPRRGQLQTRYAFFRGCALLSAGVQKTEASRRSRAFASVGIQKTAPILPTGRTEARHMEQRCSGGRSALRAPDDSGPRQSGSATRTAQPVSILGKSILRNV